MARPPIGVHEGLRRFVEWQRPRMRRYDSPVLIRKFDVLSPAGLHGRLGSVSCDRAREIPVQPRCLRREPAGDAPFAAGQITIVQPILGGDPRLPDVLRETLRNTPRSDAVPVAGRSRRCTRPRRRGGRFAGNMPAALKSCAATGGRRTSIPRRTSSTRHGPGSARPTRPSLTMIRRFPSGTCASPSRPSNDATFTRAFPAIVDGRSLGFARGPFRQQQQHHDLSVAAASRRAAFDQWHVLRDAHGNRAVAGRVFVDPRAALRRLCAGRIAVGQRSADPPGNRTSISLHERLGPATLRPDHAPLVRLRRRAGSRSASCRSSDPAGDAGLPPLLLWTGLSERSRWRCRRCSRRPTGLCRFRRRCFGRDADRAACA